MNDNENDRIESPEDTYFLNHCRCRGQSTNTQAVYQQSSDQIEEYVMSKMCRLLILAPLFLCGFLTAAPRVGQAENLKFVVTDSRLPAASYRHTQPVYDGDDSVYLVGGRNGGYLDHITRYSVSTGEVTVIGSFSRGVLDGAAFMDNDDIIRFGGWIGPSETTADIHRISTVDGSSTHANSLPEPMGSFRGAWDPSEGVFYMFGGGKTGAGVGLNSVLMYNASNNALAEVAQLPEARAFASAVWDDEQGLTYIFGGQGTPLNRDILTFDPATRTVTKLPAKLPFAMQHPNAVYAKEYGGRALIFDISGLVSFDPETNVVQQLVVEGWPRSLEFPSSVYVPKLARIYIFGGFGRFDGETSWYRDEISYINVLDGDDTSTTMESSTTDTSLEPTTEPESETEVPSTPEPPLPTTTLPPSTEAPFCPPSGVHNFPYPGNCTLYIRCFDGLEQILSCAPLLFDKIDLVCKPPSQAVCDEEIPITCPPEGYYSLPHQSSCSKYYECIEGKAYESECAPSTYFDTTPDLMHCNLAELALCNAECPRTGIAFVPIRARDCKWYKVCVEGNSVNLECGRGEVYSPSEAKCVPDDAYACPYANAAEDEADEP